MQRRNAIGSVVVVVAVLVVIIVGIVAFVVVNSGYAETASAESPSGIQLRASINTTSVLVGHTLSISVSLLNMLSESNNISTANDWTIQGFPIAVWGPCNFGLPVWFVVVSGSYSAEQLEQVTVNASQSEVSYMCAEGGSVKFIDFQPESSQANLTGALMIGGGYVPHQPLGSFNLESNFNISGYWDYPLTPQDSGDLLTPSGSCCIAFQYPEVGPLTSHVFIPGVYTLAVADEWGQTLILHFTVEASAMN